MKWEKFPNGAAMKRAIWSATLEHYIQEGLRARALHYIDSLEAYGLPREDIHAQRASVIHSMTTRAGRELVGHLRRGEFREAGECWMIGWGNEEDALQEIYRAFSVDPAFGISPEATSDRYDVALSIFFFMGGKAFLSLRPDKMLMRWWRALRCLHYGRQRYMRPHTRALLLSRSAWFWVFWPWAGDRRMRDAAALVEEIAAYDPAQAARVARRIGNWGWFRVSKEFLKMWTRARQLAEQAEAKSQIIP